MRLIYENERGKITMCGGGQKEWNITQIKGISLPETDVSAVRYPYMAGQMVTRANITERYITISGDVRDKTRKQLSRAANIFSAPGTLYITAFAKTKKISVRCMSFEPGQSKGVFVPFTVQFCADYPFFEDLYETATELNSREKRLASPFVLKCAFSDRILKNNVVNRGDVPAEPVLEIYSLLGAKCPYGITVKNLHTGKSFTLNTDISAKELITVDVKKRKIISNQRGNILPCLNEFSELSEFTVEAGVCTLEVVTKEISGELQVVCKHTNNYVSADV